MVSINRDLHVDDLVNLHTIAGESTRTMNNSTELVCALNVLDLDVGLRFSASKKYVVDHFHRNSRGDTMSFDIKKMWDIDRLSKYN